MPRNSVLKKCVLWAALACLSAILALGLYHLNVPAAFLLGPMLIAICFGVSSAEIAMPPYIFLFAQATIGCLLAHSLNEAIVFRILEDWPAMCLVLIMTIGAGALIGWVMAHYGRFSGPTAAWGSSPGGAAAMIVMSGEFCADMRLVAFMQYLRVLLVVATASLAAGVLGPEQTSIVVPAPESHDMDGIAGTLALIVIGALAGRFLRIPAGSLLLPMIIGALLSGFGLMDLPIPPFLPIIAFCLVGWHIGLPFTRPVFRLAFRALPQFVLSALSLIVLCWASAFMLTVMIDIPPLTAYLATSPGGLESIAAIAVDRGADAPFILALQTLRLFAVILTGPIIARLICRSLEK